jgi:dihydroorotase
MNRRQFVSTAIFGTTFVPRVLAAAAKYDLILKGGRVIDPSRKLDAIRDVAIADGRIAAVAAEIKAGPGEIIDAHGKLVVPGLIDIHTHAARVADGPALCLADGVTGWIDAGSQGADRIGETIAIAKSAPQQCRVLINIGRAGILPEGDTMDLNRADVAAAREAIGKNRDMIAGVKARLSRDVAGPNDFEVLRRAQEVASSFSLPVMIHMGQTVTPLFSNRATSSLTCLRRRRTASSTTAGIFCRRLWLPAAAASGSTSAMGAPAICGGTLPKRY